MGWEWGGSLACLWIDAFKSMVASHTRAHIHVHIHALFLSHPLSLFQTTERRRQNGFTANLKQKKDFGNPELLQKVRGRKRGHGCVEQGGKGEGNRLAGVHACVWVVALHSTHTHTHPSFNTRHDTTRRRRPSHLLLPPHHTTRHTTHNHQVIEVFGIDQHSSNYPPELFDPHGCVHAPPPLPLSSPPFGLLPSSSPPFFYNHNPPPSPTSPPHSPHLHAKKTHTRTNKTATAPRTTLTRCGPCSGSWRPRRWWPCPAARRRPRYKHKENNLFSLVQKLESGLDGLWDGR